MSYHHPLFEKNKIGYADKQRFARWVRSRRDLKPHVKVLMDGLLDHHNHHTGQCNPYDETLAATCGVPLRSLERAIADAKAAKLITKKKTKGAPIYAVNFALMGAQDPPHTADHSEPQDPPHTADHSECDGPPPTAVKVRRTRRLRSANGGGSILEGTDHRTDHRTVEPPKEASTSESPTSSDSQVETPRVSAPAGAHQRVEKVPLSQIVKPDDVLKDCRARPPCVGRESRASSDALRNLNTQDILTDGLRIVRGYAVKPSASTVALLRHLNLATLDRTAVLAFSEWLDERGASREAGHLAEALGSPALVDGFLDEEVD